MPKTYHPNREHFDQKSPKLSEFQWSATRDLAEDAGLRNFSCNIRRLEQGKYSYPYHFHHRGEEMFHILEGQGELRTPEGIRKVEKGDIIMFETGPEGAHQIRNPNPEPLIYLDLRTVHSLDLCEYPDSRKINIIPKMEITEKGRKAEYFDGEDHPEQNWKTD